MKKICPECNGEGRIKTVVVYRVTRDMAIDGCDFSLEGQPFEVEVIVCCEYCGGTGEIMYTDEKISSILSTCASETECELSKYALELKLSSNRLRAACMLLLDHVDYTSGNCRINEMVGAILPKDVIQKTRDILQQEKLR